MKSGRRHALPRIPACELRFNPAGITTMSRQATADGKETPFSLKSAGTANRRFFPRSAIYR